MVTTCETERPVSSHDRTARASVSRDFRIHFWYIVPRTYLPICSKDKDIWWKVCKHQQKTENKSCLLWATGQHRACQTTGNDKTVVQLLKIHANYTKTKTETLSSLRILWAREGISNIQTTIKASWFKVYVLIVKGRPYARRWEWPVPAVTSSLQTWAENQLKKSNYCLRLRKQLTYPLILSLSTEGLSL